MNRVCIIGLGWLGKQVGHYLMEKECVVSGTTTSLDKVKVLGEKFKESFCLNIIKKEYDRLLLKQFEYYIITIPPSSLGPNYSRLMFGFVQEIYALNPFAKIIYTSSISIYGNTPKEVDETSHIQPERESAKEIVKFENLLLDNYWDKVTILRLGGLCGKNRHPVTSLSGKINIGKPNAVINLVHAEDISRFIYYIIQKKDFNGIYNLCSSEHPERQRYYKWAAKKLNLPIPSFNKDDKLKDKTVICNAILNLDFKLKYYSPYCYPELLQNE